MGTHTHSAYKSKQSMSQSASRRGCLWWKAAPSTKRKLLNNPVLIWGPRDEVTVPKADRMSVAEPKIAARFLVPML